MFQNASLPARHVGLLERGNISVFWQRLWEVSTCAMRPPEVHCLVILGSALELGRVRNFSGIVSHEKRRSLAPLRVSLYVGRSWRRSFWPWGAGGHGNNIATCLRFFARDHPFLIACCFPGQCDRQRFSERLGSFAPGLAWAPSCPTEVCAWFAWYGMSPLCVGRFRQRVGATMGAQQVGADLRRLPS